MPEEDLLNEELRKSLTPNPRSNYMVDIAGRLGAGVYAPGLTNLSNTLTVSSHGGNLSGFSPDESATNSLAKVIKQRKEQGGQLSLEDIASNMGTATNDVKRAIIDACYAAGYNFDTVKKLFPNLEQLVAPSTSLPTSAYYLRDLTSPQPTAFQHTSTNLSPLYSLTPTSTNVIRQSSDWLNPEESKLMAQPLTEKEKEHIVRFGVAPEPWNPTDYNPTPHRPANQIMKELDDLKARYTKLMSAATNATEIDLLSKQWQKEIWDIK